MITKTYKRNVFLLPTEPKTIDVNLLPKEPDEKIARLLMPELAAYLTELTSALFEFLGIT